MGRQTVDSSAGSDLNSFGVDPILRSLSAIVSGVERSIVSEVERLRLGRSSGGNTAGLELVETAGLEPVETAV